MKNGKYNRKIKTSQVHEARLGRLEFRRGSSFIRNIFGYFQKKAQIFDVIYQYHGCDSWEDIFCDYNPRHLNDKADGVEVAINEITERMKRGASHQK